MINFAKEKIDKTNAILAAGVFLIAFIVYALTVQRTFSFWDCGEFIACSYILGIPHPPGTPLFVIIGRLFSLVPFVEDISYRINYISVITSAFTAMFSYLLTVRMVRFFFPKDDKSTLNNIIAYIGGICGGLFVAFSRTNWGNSVEAEVYGAALALSVMIIWLTMIFFEKRGTMSATKVMILAFYLALLGVGVHMTVYLVVPIAALFFILDKSSTTRDWLIVCGFIIFELLLIFLLSNKSNGAGMFYFVSGVLALVVAFMLYKKINWAILIAVGSVSTIMISFSLFIKVLPFSVVLLIALGLFAQKKRMKFDWKQGLAILLIAVVGLSVHAYIPIRSEMNPRIDENNPSRDFRTFVNFLDRKQYGQVSMTDRMFNRRAQWENQFGRHPHMGFWSYFEEQYSGTGWKFIFPFFALGVIGMYTLLRRRLEIGLPFITLFLITSVGLVLYMNFADGTKYNFLTTDAYLEVRDRDYFFTPAFVFFGIAMGLGVSAVMSFLKEVVAKNNPSLQKTVVYASSLLILLPAVSLGHNFHPNDRSENYTPYIYAKNILDSCEENAILFTAGDNDTFPLWCIQEVYKYRLDVTVVNLSLLNTDWYVEQMKNRYNVPISLTDDQILWYPEELPNGRVISKPKKMFHDRPRKRNAFMMAQPYSNRLLKVQDMMVDEIVLENKWKRPIYFSSLPYAESPLNLRERAISEGLVYRLERTPQPEDVNIEKAYDNFMNVYRYDGYGDSKVYRDENATGVFVGVGVNAVRLFDALLAKGDTTRAVALGEHINTVYPEYWQMYLLLGDIYDSRGDSTKTTELYSTLRDTLQSFSESNPENLFYRQDLGLTMIQIGLRTNDKEQQDEGLKIIMDAFDANQNSSYAFRKAVSALSLLGRFSDIRDVGVKHAKYSINLQDGLVQQITGMSPPNQYGR